MNSLFAVLPGTLLLRIRDEPVSSECPLTWHVYANIAAGPASNASNPTFRLYRPAPVSAPLELVLVRGNPAPEPAMAECGLCSMLGRT